MQQAMKMTALDEFMNTPIDEFGAGSDLRIIEYSPEYQSAIEELILPIQTIEFSVPITREDQPDLLNIANKFQTGLGNFWIAVLQGEVVGTIGVVDIGDNKVALKKMFVRDGFRGKEKGVSLNLMLRAKEWCRQNKIHTILLGTVDVMQAAHRFYEKHGFAEIAKSSLPACFPLVAVDTKFYCLEF